MRNPPIRLMPIAKWWCLLCVFLLGCSTNKTLDIQGHRGCRGLLPENSLPAFEKAITLGVTTLELDIAITKDKAVVVSHEPFMSRNICYNPQGNIITEDQDMMYNLYEMTHQQIKQFDCGSKYHPNFPDQGKVNIYKPLLQEVFNLASGINPKVRFNIEIKSKPKYYGIYTPHPKEYVDIVVKEIEQSPFLNLMNLQSFDLAILEEIKKQNPNMPVALLVDEDEHIDDKLAKLSYKPEIISPYYKLLSKEMVSQFKKSGYQVIPWTVNEVSDIKKLVSWQVDGIITDYPDRLIKL